MCLRHFLQRPSRRPQPHAANPASCFPLGHSFCSPTGAGVRAALIRRNIPPRRGPCRHHTAIKRPGGCKRRESQPLPAGATPFSPALLAELHGACDCWAGPASWAAGWTRAARLGLSCCSPTEAAASPVCTVSPPGPAPSQCHSQLPTVPGRLWAQVKMQIKSGCFFLML